MKEVIEMIEVNTFKKYCPNVWVAECNTRHQKGDIITLTTKYDKEVDCVVYNLVDEKDDKYIYSIVRVEDMSYAERKAEKYNNSADNHAAKSDDYYNASNEGKEFLALGEPIKIGHHSEKRHRALIERNQKRTDKFVEHRQISEKMEHKAEYWEKKAKEITLAMPESVEYFEKQLETAIKYHQDLKSGKIAKEHSYSLTYAKKEVNEIKKKIKIAQILWR